MSRSLRQMKPDQVWRAPSGSTTPQGLTGLCPGKGSEDGGRRRGDEGGGSKGKGGGGVGGGG